jgi:hypothetical protein
MGQLDDQYAALLAAQNPPPATPPAKPKAAAPTTPSASTPTRPPAPGPAPAPDEVAAALAKTPVAPVPDTPAPVGPPKASAGTEAVLKGAAALGASPETLDTARRAATLPGFFTPDDVLSAAVPQGLQTAATGRVPKAEDDKPFMQQSGAIPDTARLLINQQDPAAHRQAEAYFDTLPKHKDVALATPESAGDAEARALAKDTFGDLTPESVSAGDINYTKKVQKFLDERQGQLLRRWGYYDLSDTPEEAQRRNDLLAQAAQRARGDLVRMAQLGVAPTPSAADLAAIPDAVKGTPVETAMRAVRAVLPQQEILPGGQASRSEGLGWWALGTLQIPEYLTSAGLDDKLSWEDALAGRKDLVTAYLDRHPDVAADFASGDPARFSRATEVLGPLMAASMLFPDPTMILSGGAKAAGKAAEYAELAGRVTKEMREARAAGTAASHLLDPAVWRKASAGLHAERSALKAEAAAKLAAEGGEVTATGLDAEVKAAAARRTAREGVARSVEAADRAMAGSRDDFRAAVRAIEKDHPEMAREWTDRVHDELRKDPDVAAALGDRQRERILTGAPPPARDFAAERAKLEQDIADLKTAQKAADDEVRAGRPAAPGANAHFADALKAKAEEMRRLDADEAAARGAAKLDAAVNAAGRRVLEDMKATVAGTPRPAPAPAPPVPPASDVNAARLEQAKAALADARKREREASVAYDTAVATRDTATAAHRSALAEALRARDAARADLRAAEEAERGLGDLTPPPAESKAQATVYHGTSDATFQNFDPYQSEHGLFGQGSYFTESEDIAREYKAKGRGTKPGVYEASLDIRNPIDMDAPADMAKWEEVLKRRGIDLADLLPKRKVVTNEMVYRALEQDFIDRAYPKWDAAQEIQDVLREMGHDGITHVGGGRHAASKGVKHRVWIAFDPEQIVATRPMLGDQTAAHAEALTRAEEALSAHGDPGHPLRAAARDAEAAVARAAAERDARTADLQRSLADAKAAHDAVAADKARLAEQARIARTPPKPVSVLNPDETLDDLARSFALNRQATNNANFLLEKNAIVNRIKGSLAAVYRTGERLLVPAHETLGASLHLFTRERLDAFSGARKLVEREVARALDAFDPAATALHPRVRKVLEDHTEAFRMALSAKQVSPEAVVVAARSWIRPGGGLDPASVRQLLQVVEDWRAGGEGLPALRDALVAESQRIEQDAPTLVRLRAAQHGDATFTDAVTFNTLRFSLLNDLRSEGVAVSVADGEAANRWASATADSARGRQVVARALANPCAYQPPTFGALLEGIAEHHARPMVPAGSAPPRPLWQVGRLAAQREMERDVEQLLGAVVKLDDSSTYLPRAVRDRLGAHLDGVVATYQMPQWTGTTQLFQSYFKQANTTGLLTLRSVYFTNNKIGDFDQAVTMVGSKPALKMSAQSMFTDLLVANVPGTPVPALPTVALLRDAAKKLEPGTTLRQMDRFLAINSFALGAETSAIMDGIGTVTLGGRTYDAAHLYRACLDHGVFENFIEGDLTRTVAQATVESMLGSTTSRNPVSRFGAAVGRGALRYERNLRDTANLVATRRRVALFAALLDRGASPEQAATLVRETLYDYSHSLHPFERGLLQTIYPFWNFEKNNNYRVYQAFRNPGKWTYSLGWVPVTPGYRAKGVHLAKKYLTDVLSAAFDSTDEFGYDVNSMREEPDPTLRQAMYDDLRRQGLDDAAIDARITDAFQKGELPNAAVRYEKVLADLKARGLTTEQIQKALHPERGSAEGMADMRAYYAPDPTRRFLPEWSRNRYAVWLGDRRSQALVSWTRKGVGAFEDSGDSRDLAAIVEDSNGAALGRAASLVALAFAMKDVLTSEPRGPARAREAVRGVVGSTPFETPSSRLVLSLFGQLPRDANRPVNLPDATGAAFYRLLGPGFVTDNRTQARGEDPSQDETTKYQSRYTMDPTAAAYMSMILAGIGAVSMEQSADAWDDGITTGLTGIRTYHASLDKNRADARREVGQRLEDWTAALPAGASAPLPIPATELRKREDVAVAGTAPSPGDLDAARRAVEGFRRFGAPGVTREDMVQARRWLAAQGVAADTLKDAQVVDEVEKRMKPADAGKDLTASP